MMTCRFTSAMPGAVVLPDGLVMVSTVMARAVRPTAAGASARRTALSTAVCAGEVRGAFDTTYVMPTISTTAAAAPTGICTHRGKWDGAAVGWMA